MRLVYYTRGRQTFTSARSPRSNGTRLNLYITDRMFEQHDVFNYLQTEK